MLSVNPDKRPEVKDILIHPWITSKVAARKDITKEAETKKSNPKVTFRTCITITIYMSKIDRSNM